jgi:hypothetical protein
MSEIELKPGQVWVPEASGVKARTVITVALDSWQRLSVVYTVRAVSAAPREMFCSTETFRGWVKRTRATLQVQP